MQLQVKCFYGNGHTTYWFVCSISDGKINLFNRHCLTLTTKRLHLETSVVYSYESNYEKYSVIEGDQSIVSGVSDFNFAIVFLQEPMHSGMF